MQQGVLQHTAVPISAKYSPSVNDPISIVFPAFFLRDCAVRGWFGNGLGPRCSFRLINLRKYESISIDPVRIVRIEAHELVEENMCGRGEAHGGSGMTGVGFEGGIDL